MRTSLIRHVSKATRSASSAVAATTSEPLKQLTSDAPKPKPFSEIPGPTRVPLLGNMHALRSSTKQYDDEKVKVYFETLVDMHEKYGPIVKQDAGWGRGTVVHVFDPEDSRTVFSADGKQPHIVPLQETTQKYRELKGMNPGLGNLNGEEWYRLRSAVQQAMMRPQAVHKYLPFVNEVSDQLVKHIKANLSGSNQADMRVIAGRWSLEAAGLIVFEKRLGALSDNIQWADELVKVNRDIFRLSAKLKFALPVYQYVNTPKWKEMVRLEDAFYEEAMKLINDAIAKLRNKDKDVKEDEMLFASHLINKPELSDRDIQVVFLSLFSDGLSTTAPMLIYNLFNIAKNAEIQQQLRDEINKVAKPWEEITPDKLNRLPFLKACIKETFRLFPIGTEISRIPQQDLVLSGYHVPAGTPIDINTNVLMRSSKFFTDPLDFRPQRWLRESGKAEQSHPFAFLPFGFGPRMCAGRRFAEQDLQVTLARLITSFDIKHEHSPIRQIYETLLLPEGDCHFTFTPIY